MFEKIYAKIQEADRMRDAELQHMRTWEEIQSMPVIDLAAWVAFADDPYQPKLHPPLCRTETIPQDTDRPLEEHEFNAWNDDPGLY